MLLCNRNQEKKCTHTLGGTNSQQQVGLHICTSSRHVCGVIIAINKAKYHPPSVIDKAFFRFFSSQDRLPDWHAKPLWARPFPPLITPNLLLRDMSNKDAFVHPPDRENAKGREERFA